MDGAAVYLAPDRGVEEQRRELRAEDERAGRLRVEQGLLADPVARQEQLLLALVPDGEGEHAAQVLRRVRAPLLVGVDDGLGVAVGAEAVAEVFEPFFKLAEVVDLAVEDDPGGALFVGDGLLPAREVDDGEPPHGEPDVTLEVAPLLVRAAVMDGLVHAAEQRRVRRPPVKVDHADDATHQKLILSEMSSAICSKSFPRSCFQFV